MTTAVSGNNVKTKCFALLLFIRCVRFVVACAVVFCFLRVVRCFVVEIIFIAAARAPA